ncbi:MAG: PIN domain-containing protein [Acidobacteria bacterium]|nr:MAG: PIN domain-containing protein [Acidobacteriota bacterium]
MVRFWDTSAIIPLVALEETTPLIREILAADRNVIVSFLTTVEITSAIWRKSRETKDDDARRESERRVRDFLEPHWTVVDEVEPIARIARRLLTQHPLRTADAINLAAAIHIARDPEALPFVTNDKRLKSAAQSEGFPTLP